MCALSRTVLLRHRPDRVKDGLQALLHQCSALARSPGFDQDEHAWRRGERWFWDCLLDADLGANAMNWQYVAGSGVDAPVFSRMMAPFVQSPKFVMADYIRRFVPELAHLGDAAIHAPHEWGTAPASYPPPIIGHVAARARAMAAWEGLRAG